MNSPFTSWSRFGLAALVAAFLLVGSASLAAEHAGDLTKAVGKFEKKE